MNDNTGCLPIIIFLLIVSFLMSWQLIYAISEDAPQCAFSRDVITCVEIARANK